MNAYLIQIDRSLCSGFGSCLKEAPTIFALDGDGVATLLVTETADEDVLAAAGSCPMGAIAVFDAETGQEAA
jgi:ferredoxin